MKRQLSILSIVLSIGLFGFTTLDNLHSDKIKKIINHTDLLVTVETGDGYDFFNEAKYEPMKGDITFLTNEKVKEINVLQEKEEKLVYVLPVKTNKIVIGKSLFDKGQYSLLFKTAITNKTYMTKVEVY